MNKATSPALFNPLNNNLKFALFHSTPVWDAKRRTHWNSGGGRDKDTTKNYNRYKRKCRKLDSKDELLRNVGAFAEQLFENWRSSFDDKNTKNKWFRRDFNGKSSKGEWASPKGPYSARSFDFCGDDEDIDVENIFRGSFGGDRFFYCSFVGDELPGSRWSSRYSNSSRKSWKWRYLDDEENDDTSSESDSYCSKSDRLALGLCASGPLKIEDVKIAYRVCALKWHPDRHEGEAKAVAEEKFKACNAAYQSLCDKLSPA